MADTGGPKRHSICKYAGKNSTQEERKEKESTGTQSAPLFLQILRVMVSDIFSIISLSKKTVRVEHEGMGIN